MSNGSLPRGLQSALRLPLISTLDMMGGRARPGDVYAAIAARLGLDDDALAATRRSSDGRAHKLFAQQVRWARQTAVVDGLVSKDVRGVWDLTQAGRRFARLTKVKPGYVVMLYRRDDGIALCAHAEDAASVIGKGSLDLILTSPPYPVVQRAYGRFDVGEWLTWMRDLVGLWKELLTPQGTLAVNLMDVHASGSPNLDPYVERFTLSCLDDHGLKLAGRMPWASPTKLGHIEWTAKRKVRPRNVLEHVLLFSPSDHPNWDATRLPRRPAPARSASKLASDARRAGKIMGTSVRPSGLDINLQAFAAGERLSDNLISAGGASGADAYSRRCRAAGIAPHPARFPIEVPKRVILLTTDVGETVYDPMAGSNTTGMVASMLNRRWISSEPVLDYARSSELRFSSSCS